MSFNEQNTIENALVNLLKGQQNDALHDDHAPYSSPVIPHHSSLRYQYIHGENLALYGKQPQDVFVDTWLKDALCRLNKPLAANPDLADEVIHRLRGVLLEAGYSGLIRANEIFQDWLLGRISMPLGKDGEHVTIHLLDFELGSVAQHRRTGRDTTEYAYRAKKRRASAAPEDAAGNPAIFCGVLYRQAGRRQAEFQNQDSAPLPAI
jgi:hypothetical protein